MSLTTRERLTKPGSELPRRHQEEHSTCYCRERDTAVTVRLMVTEPSAEIAFPPLDFMTYSHKIALFSFFVA